MIAALRHKRNALASLTVLKIIRVYSRARILVNHQANYMELLFHSTVFWNRKHCLCSKFVLVKLAYFLGNIFETIALFHIKISWARHDFLDTAYYLHYMN